MKNNIFNTVVNKENTIPNNISIDDVEIQYQSGLGWQELDYKPIVGVFLHMSLEIMILKKSASVIKEIPYAPLEAETTVSISMSELRHRWSFRKVSQFSTTQKM